ncbi:hypothetical protein OS493_001002 [Desmophyllum pertusum]|uniref:Uncharacterized protein n=1 Tax=Desmophyllum pertusum TaxID=174260 RepID=A0A9W9ZUZ4_9CNID|nr:hypothetical protein OS493_001002 [Desmophyllum pertusum]
MSPAILIDADGKVELVIGASGGKRITTAVSLVLMNKLWFGQSLSDAVERTSTPCANWCRIRQIIIIIIVVVVVILLLAATAGLIYYFLTKESDQSSGGPYKREAVATDTPQCSQIGKDILNANGSAVDAAIAAMFCLGVVSMHSSGIVGGGSASCTSSRKRPIILCDLRESFP